MRTIRFDVPFAPGPATPDVEVLLDEGRVKVRRIDLAAGARIPPCEMREDVVFVVLSGRVVFSTESSTPAVDAPGAVYIPGRGQYSEPDGRIPGPNPGRFMPGN